MPPEKNICAFGRLSSKLAVATPGDDAKVAGSVEPWAANALRVLGGGSRLNTGQVFPVSIPYFSCVYLLLNKQTQLTSC